MSRCALLYFVVGVTITTASYAFFLQMPGPGQMMQMGQQMIMPQPQVCPPCECNKS